MRRPPSQGTLELIDFLYEDAYGKSIEEEKKELRAQLEKERTEREFERPSVNVLNLNVLNENVLNLNVLNENVLNVLNTIPNLSKSFILTKNGKCKKLQIF